MRFHKLVIRNIVSPYGMTLISLLLFLLAFVFPPSLYSSYIQEPDFVFLDPASLVFFLMCTLGFLLGLMFVDFVFPLHSFTYERRKTRFSPMWFFLLPLVAGAALMVLSIVLLLRNNTYLLELLSTAEGDRLSPSEGSNWTAHSFRHFPCFWELCCGRYGGKINLIYRDGEGPLCIGHLCCNSGDAGFVDAKVGSRRLMPIIAGLGILFVLRRFINGKLTLAWIVKSASILAGWIVALFISFSVLRGVADLDTLIGSILGYTIAAYNRMAAILDGRLHYPFSGKGTLHFCIRGVQ